MKWTTSGTRFFFPTMQTGDCKTHGTQGSSAKSKEITEDGHVALAELAESFGWSLGDVAPDEELSESLEISILPEATSAILTKAIDDLGKAMKASDLLIGKVELAGRGQLGPFALELIGQLRAEIEGADEQVSDMKFIAKFKKGPRGQHLSSGTIKDAIANAASRLRDLQDRWKAVRGISAGVKREPTED